MNENIIESLTKYIFANFNSYHGGDSDFEKFGIKLVQVAYPEAIVRQSSGSDAGGDGGRDGIAVINGEEYKIACSIDKNVKGKIRHEASLKKAYHGKMVYCTNQIVAEKVKIELQNEIKGLIIIDFNQAVSLVMNNEELKKLLGVPAAQLAVSFEYLRKHNQFFAEKKTIDSYIERIISTKNRKLKMLDWFIDLPGKTSFRKLFLIEAPAGFGKTSALKKLHQEILKTGKYLPPVYIDLEYSYIPGQLHTSLEAAYAVSGDYKLEGCFLILDSYDRIGTKADALFNDISVFLSNQSTFRSVLIAAREGEYDINAINRFANKHNIEVDKAQLEAIDEHSLSILLDSTVSDRSTKNRILDFLNLNSVYDNIFYVTNVIRFYSDKNEVPGTIDDLLAYLLNKECELCNRSKNQVLAFSFYSMFFETDKFKSEFGYSIKSFSHQIVREYAAAIVLSQLSLDKVLQYTTIDGFVINNLKNTVGILLNHLLYSGEEKGQILLNRLKCHIENYSVFFKIESAALSNSIRVNIFEGYVNYVLEEHVYDIDEEVARFIGLNFTVYLDLIVNKLICADDVDKQNLLLGIMMPVVRQGKYSRFFNLAKKLTEFCYSRIINDKPLCSWMLTWVFTYIREQIPELDAEELRAFQKFLLNDISSPDTFIGFCFIFHASVKKVSEKEYSAIWEKYWELCERNIQSAYYVPSEIKEGYKEESTLIFASEPFFDFLIHAIEEGAISYSKILGLIKTSLQKSKSAVFQDREIIRFLIYGINQYGTKNKETKLVPEIIEVLCELSAFDSSWHDLFTKSEQNSIALIKMMCMTYKRVQDLSSSGLRAIAEEIIKSPDLFNLVLSCIAKVELFDFLRVYLITFSRVDFSDEIYEQLPVSLRKDIDRVELEKKSNLERLQRKNALKTEQQKQSIHILFNEQELLNKIEGIYSELDYSMKINSSLREYSKTHDDYFCVYCIKELAQEDFASFLQEWQLENNAYKNLWLLISYINHLNIGMNIFNRKELNKVLHWIMQLIPMIDSNQYMQSIIAVALQYREIQRLFTDSSVALLPCGWWHTFIDNPTFTEFKSVGSYNYQLFSVDFLYQIVSKDEVDEYILEHLVLDNRIRGEFFAMYIDSHKEIVKSVIVRKAAKERYLKFLIWFLDDSELSLGNLEIFDVLGIHIKDFPCDIFYESLSTALLADEEKFKLIPSWIILNYFISASNKFDQEKGCTYLQRIFRNINENDECKKKVAEMYMLHIQDNPEINCWYIKYLMRLGSSISKEFAYPNSRKTFFCDMDSLRLFPDLVSTCEGKYDDYHKIIISFVEKPLKYFCNIIQLLSKEQREILLQTMDTLCSSGKIIWAIQLRKEALMTLIMSNYQKTEESEIIILCKNILDGTS